MAVVKRRHARRIRRFVWALLDARGAYAEYLVVDRYEALFAAQDVWASLRPEVGRMYGWGEFTQRVAAPVQRRLAREERRRAR